MGLSICLLIHFFIPAQEADSSSSSSSGVGVFPVLFVPRGAWDPVAAQPQHRLLRALNLDKPIGLSSPEPSSSADSFRSLVADAQASNALFPIAVCRDPQLSACTKLGVCFVQQPLSGQADGVRPRSRISSHQEALSNTLFGFDFPCAPAAPSAQATFAAAHKEETGDSKPSHAAGNNAQANSNLTHWTLSACTAAPQERRPIVFIAGVAADTDALLGYALALFDYAEQLRHQHHWPLNHTSGWRFHVLSSHAPQVTG
jgi:hypothetical protein